MCVCVCVCVGVELDRCPHAVCNICQKYRNINKETWTTDQVKNHRRVRNSTLVCGACKSRGYTPTDRELYPCKACTNQQGRCNFGPIVLQEWNRAQKNNKQYSLVCLKCKTKEAAILEKLRAKDALLCTCKQPLGHGPKCRVGPFWYSGYNKGITLEDLRFLRFREKHVTKYNIR